jgi:hypothetical protein
MSVLTAHTFWTAAAGRTQAGVLRGSERVMSTGQQRNLQQVAYIPSGEHASTCTWHTPSFPSLQLVHATPNDVV